MNKQLQVMQHLATVHHSDTIDYQDTVDRMRLRKLYTMIQIVESETSYCNDSPVDAVNIDWETVS